MKICSKTEIDVITIIRTTKNFAELEAENSICPEFE